MENPTLHTQKVTILSRLVKESSLTLEEALLLLQEEEVEDQTPVSVTPAWVGGTVSPYIQPYNGTLPLMGSSTSVAGFGTITLSTSNLGSSTTTTAFLNTPSTPTADLNN
jgi:hypothetical protein